MSDSVRIPADPLIAPGQSPRLGEIAAAHPRLRMAVDHLGLRLRPERREVESDFQQLLELAALPNVCVKATAFG